MKSRILYACFVLLMFTFTNAIAFATTYTIPVTGGGTLTYAAAATSESCKNQLGDGNSRYSITNYSGFSYTASGTTTPLSGTDQSIDDPGYSGDLCAPPSDFPPVTLASAGLQVIFTPSGKTGGIAQLGVTGFLNPKYVIVGVVYAPPGPSSNVTYTNSTLVGDTTTTSSSFQNDVNVTVSVTSGIGAWKPGTTGFGVKITGTDSTDYIQGSNSSSTVTVSKQTTVADKEPGTGNACAPVNHDYDWILLWLNPLMIYTVYPGTTNVQWNGYGYDPNDLAGPDVYPVQVGYLNGHFADSPSIDAVLARGWVIKTEPGMVWPAGEGPGLTTADKANILQADPFTNPSYVLPSPLPTTTADGRFTQDPYPPNPVPYAPGGYNEAYSVVNTNTKSEAQGATYSVKQAYGTEEQFAGGIFLGSFSIDIKTSDTFTWAYTWLDTLTITQTDTNALSVTGPTGCNPPYSGAGEFVVFQDNLYGTFMFYPSN